MLLCFLTGTVFWFLNALNKEYNTTIEYPIEFTYENKSDLSVVSPLPEYIKVELKGNGWQLLSFTFDYFPVPAPITLDKPTKVKSISTNGLRPILKNFFNDISLVAIYPDSLHFDIQQKVKKIVKLYVDKANLNIEKGHVISSDIRIYPNEVVYEGPISFIEDLPDSIQIYPNQELIDKDIDENVSLEPTNLGVLAISQNSVHLSFNIGKLAELMHRVDIDKVNFPSEYTLRDSVAWVSFSILQQRVNAIADMDFRVIADFRKLNIADSTINLEIVRYPKFIRNIRLDTSKVRIRKYN